MAGDPLSRSTATSENALSERERGGFLARRLACRFATLRADGWPHVTPLWYVWEESAFWLSLGDSRLHLKNIRRDDRVTVCVDVDPRLDAAGGPVVAAVCFGRAQLVEDEREVRRLNDAIALRYLGEVSPRFEEASWAESRTGVVVVPERWLDWDLGKA